MKIKEMFKDDINRQINGVVKVGDEQEKVVEQELKEYVVTTELKKHFKEFFDAYSESFDEPTENVGVWITGFFGSGKSHFLKMLSYLLENKEVSGKKAVEYFEDKFNDQLSFMNIQKSTQTPTETILFNIDVESFANKDESAVTKVFAKVFYNHLGFYGRDFKVSKLEQLIAKNGKFEEFKEAFKEFNGESWEESRGDYFAWTDDIEKAIKKVMDVNAESVIKWLDNNETVELSVEQLVDEIKEYVQSKGKEFRLLFMVDEVGQYIGDNLSMLLNLQSLIETLGSECQGQVWVVATGQEALDDIIRVRQNAFSRIMARFAIRLPLTSSSVDEVIQKRLLTKTDQAKQLLLQEYDNNASALKNQYAFDTEIKDIQGYKSADDFVNVYPFVPYQFTIMQKVFNEIRKHGHAGKHQSSGERSMLNGFQESAQKVEEDNELTLVPMYLFYDTLHSFLDTSVRSVIERAERAANEGNGLTKEDVDLLKLLYLIRYIDDIPSNIDNLTILSANKVNEDKIALKENIKDSLDRLDRQNYISSVNGIYRFLTDEEQDVDRDIRNTDVDTAAIISEISSTIFDDIYTSKKYKYVNYDFAFNGYVDSQMHGNGNAEMSLKFITVASDETNNFKLIKDSNNYASICVLSNKYKYYEKLEKAKKIDKYAKQKNINALTDSVKSIIQNRMSESTQLKRDAKEELEKAIIDGTFYVLGEEKTFNGGTPKAVIDSSLRELVEGTFDHLNHIEENYDNDFDIKQILMGAKGRDINERACDDIYGYLERRGMNSVRTSMNDVQSDFQSKPYGWKEIDIAGVVSKLIFDQKVTIKHNGEQIRSDNNNLVDYLRKKNEIGNTIVSIRESIPAAKIQKVRGILRDYFNVTDVSDDEDALIAFINKNFQNQKLEFFQLKRNYENKLYPGSEAVDKGAKLVSDVLSSNGDNLKLIDKIIELEDDLLDNKDDIEVVKNFFTNQKSLYDNALHVKHETEHTEKDYLMNNEDVKNAVESIKSITRTVNFNYSNIPQLNNHISTINNVRREYLNKELDSLKQYVDSSITDIEERCKDNSKLTSLADSCKQQLSKMLADAKSIDSIPLLVAKKVRAKEIKQNYIDQINTILASNDDMDNKKKVAQVRKTDVLPTKYIHSKDEVDAYLDEVKKKLEKLLDDNDEINIY